MPGLAEYQALLAAANGLTTATPQGNLVVVTGAIQAAMNNLVAAVAGVQMDDNATARLQVVQTTIDTCAQDATALAAGTIPAGDRLLTEGPANVLSDNVHRALASLASEGVTDHFS